MRSVTINLSIMSNEKEPIPHSIMVDRFIALANEFGKTETKERVSSALLYAASRYSAFEASSKSSHLAKDKMDALNWYSAEYRRMLDANLDEMIAMHS